MARWHEDDPDYHRYLADCFGKIADEISDKRIIPTIKILERWHLEIYGPTEKTPGTAGHIRQINRACPAAGVEVEVGGHKGLLARQVPLFTKQFCDDLRKRVQNLDKVFDGLPPENQLKQAVELASWTHARMVRIHPFADGNGRMARITTSCILMRYGIPYALPLRPRPTGSYTLASDASMRGDNGPMEQFLLREIARSTQSKE